MLFDAIVTRADDETIMLPAFTRRRNYLYTRSRQWAEPAPGQPTGAWERAATRATLHLEVAEADAVLDEMDNARFEIGIAASLFYEWRMPFGVALQRAFVSDHGSLAARGDDVLSDWSAMLESEDGATTDNRAVTTRAADIPQQWAYYALCSTFETQPPPADRAEETLMRRLRDWRLVPVGRMRFPMHDYIFIIQYCLMAKRARGDVYDIDLGAPEILSKHIVALWRALQWASLNTYLWRSVLAPAPWFDLDVAVLVAAVLGAPGRLSERLGEAVANAGPADARRFTIEFIDTVRRLKGRLPGDVQSP